MKWSFELSLKESDTLSKIEFYNGDETDGEENEPEMHLYARSNDNKPGKLYADVRFSRRAGCDDGDHEFGCTYRFFEKRQVRDQLKVIVGGNLDEALHYFAGPEMLYSPSFLSRIKEKPLLQEFIYASTYEECDEITLPTSIAAHQSGEQLFEETFANFPARQEAIWQEHGRIDPEEAEKQRQEFQLPENFTTDSTELVLSNRGLMFFPERLLGFHNLQILNFHDNKIPQIPRDITRLNALTELLLGNNWSLETLPDELCLLTTLRTLDVANTSISTLPDNIGHLRSLKVLRCANNKLTRLPGSFVLLANLVEASFHCNLLELLPEKISLLANLEQLDIICNRLTSLPLDFSKLPKLKTLHAAYNQLKMLPPNIGHMPALEFMSLQHNELSEIPDSLYDKWKLQLPGDRLKTIWLRDNCVERLSSRLAILCATKSLYLDHNQLRELPDVFHVFQALTMLNLAHNLLSDIPESFKELKALRLLSLRNNNFTEVPDELCTLPALKLINLKENHVSHGTFAMLLAILYLDKTILFEHNPLDQTDDLTRNMLIAFCFQTCGCSPQTKKEAWHYCRYRFFAQGRAQEKLQPFLPAHSIMVESKFDSVDHDTRCQYAH